MNEAPGQVVEAPETVAEKLHYASSILRKELPWKELEEKAKALVNEGVLKYFTWSHQGGYRHNCYYVDTEIKPRWSQDISETIVLEIVERYYYHDVEYRYNSHRISEFDENGVATAQYEMEGEIETEAWRLSEEQD